AVLLRPGAADLHVSLGIALHKYGDTSAAIAEFETALHLEPTNVSALYDFGSALEAGGQRDEAIRKYRQALEVRPDAAAVHNNLGVALRKVSGFGQEGLGHLRRAVELDPD